MAQFRDISFSFSPPFFYYWRGMLSLSTFLLLLTWHALTGSINRFPWHEWMVPKLSWPRPAFRYLCNLPRFTFLKKSPLQITHLKPTSSLFSYIVAIKQVKNLQIGWMSVCIQSVSFIHACMYAWKGRCSTSIPYTQTHDHKTAYNHSNTTILIIQER